MTDSGNSSDASRFAYNKKVGRIIRSDSEDCHDCVTTNLRVRHNRANNSDSFYSSEYCLTMDLRMRHDNAM